MPKLRHLTAVSVLVSITLLDATGTMLHVTLNHAVLEFRF